MIETVIALLMIVNNEIKEHRIEPSMSVCLKGKRIAMRQIKSSSNTRFECLKSEAELEDNIDGSKSIKKLILK